MEGKYKITKRGCSSSSLARMYRLKRPILVGRKTGSTTIPVPNPQPLRPGPSSPPALQEHVPISARKLGGTLWDINEVGRDGDEDEEEEVVDDQGLRKGMRRLSRGSGQLVTRLTDDPAQSAGAESKKDHRRRSCCDHSRKASANWQSVNRTSCLRTGTEIPPVTIHVESSRMSCRHDSKKNCLKEVRDCLLSSKELVKVLCRVGGRGKRTSPSLSLVSALFVELDCAFVRVERLMNEEWSKRGEVEEFLMKRFVEDKARWRFKERERVRIMEWWMAEEVEAERRRRRQTERLNQKLGEEMASAKAGLYRMSKELQSERRTKEILQHVCDELSRGIGEDRAQVEELKRDSEKVLEEVEKEREMLQLAGVLREERVRMKLSEAKYHFKEKNAAVEKLKDELEAYMSSKENRDANDDDDDGSSKLEKIEELWACFKTHDRETVKNVNAEENGSDEGDDDSVDSDLPSIELNMDDTTRSYRWSFINEEFNQDEVADEPRRSSVDRMFKGRKSLSDKINWESISLNRGAPDNTINDGNPEPNPKSQGKPNGLKGRRLIDFFSQAQAKNDEEDPKVNDKPVNLTSKIAPPAQ